MSLFRADFGRIHNYIPSFFIPSYVHPLVKISFYSTGFKSSFTMPLRIVEIDDSKSKSSISQKSCNVDASYEQCLAWFFYRLLPLLIPLQKHFCIVKIFWEKRCLRTPASIYQRAPRSCLFLTFELGMSRDLDLPHFPWITVYSESDVGVWGTSTLQKWKRWAI